MFMSFVSFFLSTHSITYNFLINGGTNMTQNQLRLSVKLALNFVCAKLRTFTVLTDDEAHVARVLLKKKQESWNRTHPSGHS